ncbi:unnamed protein product [Urochloa humidicola]
MAARPVLVPAMLLAVLLLLSGTPLSTLASLIDHPLGDLLTKTGTANASHAPAANATTASANTTTRSLSKSSVAQQQHAPPTSAHASPPPAPTPPPPPPPPPLSPEQQKEKEEKQKQRQEWEKRLDAEIREFAKIHHLVSHTNYTGTYKGIAHEFLSVHNMYRARYGVPLMRWDKKLARHARRWANHMRAGCDLTHSGSKYGESIFMSRNNWNATATAAVENWATEEPIYDKLTGECTGGHPFKDCGHFANIVNKKYQWVGCARSECVNVKSDFVICNYLSHDPSAQQH